MQNPIFDASVSPQSLTFRPGGLPALFEVTVINISDQFAEFHLEVIAPGASRSGGSPWYSLSPQVAAAKPPGDMTIFQIQIIDTPLPGFVGVVNLTVRIFSLQPHYERRLVVRLTIEPGAMSTLLSVELLGRQFAGYPRNAGYPHNLVDIPVRVRSLNPQTADVLLQLTGIDPAWIPQGRERRLQLDPGGQAEITFQCQLPFVSLALSQPYPFTIEASCRNSLPARTQGNLEIGPFGSVEFTATPLQQTIPPQRSWLPDWKSNSASFELLFQNKSNLRQQVNLQLHGKKPKQWAARVEPENANLNLAGITTINLIVNSKRPWLGLGNSLQLSAQALLSDQRLPSTEPPAHNLKVRVLPILPIWLQILVIALLAALLAWLFRPIAIGHTGFVNIVRFSRDDLSVISGSDDCTLRRWKFNAERLEPEGKLDVNSNVNCADGKAPESKGLLGVTNQEVWALRFDPVENNHLAAGLSNSAIQIWNVPLRKMEDELKVKEMVSKNDKVFDIVFTKNSNYLISGHGSGKVLIWSRRSPNEQFQPQPKEIVLGYQIRSIAISQDDKILAIAGGDKHLTLLDPNPPNKYKEIVVKASSSGANGNDNYIWSLAFVPKSSHRLAIADSDGYIRVLDLTQCENLTRESDNKECAVEIDRWQAAKQAVRSIAFSEDGLKLVSGGDDGRVVVWFLTPDSKLDRQNAPNGKEIYQSAKKINTIDINSQGTMIVSGGEEDRDGHFLVKLNNIP